MLTANQIEVVLHRLPREERVAFAIRLLAMVQDDEATLDEPLPEPTGDIAQLRAHLELKRASRR